MSGLKGSRPLPTVREAGPGDAAGILAIYAPMVTDTAVSLEDEPPAVGEIAARIKSSHLWLVCEQGELVTGYAYASRFRPRGGYRWSAEVAIYLAPETRSRGIGRTLLSALLDRLSGLGLVNAFAGIALPNPASIRLFESCGFIKVAHWNQVGFKLGAWHDVAWWQLQLRDPTTPPPSLVSEQYSVTPDQRIAD